MPVIGRLDDQVNRLLIAPAGQRDEPADAARAATKRLSGDEEGAAEEARRAAGRRAVRRDEQELPVWLL